MLRTGWILCINRFWANTIHQWEHWKWNMAGSSSMTMILHYRSARTRKKQKKVLEWHSQYPDLSLKVSIEYILFTRHKSAITFLLWWNKSGLHLNNNENKLWVTPLVENHCSMCHVTLPGCYRCKTPTCFTLLVETLKNGLSVCLSSLLCTLSCCVSQRGVCAVKASARFSSVCPTRISYRRT